MIIQQIIRFIFLIPCFVVLSAVYVIYEDLANGVVTGKYFWFYLSMGILAVWSVFAVARNMNSIRFNWNDGLILLFGLIMMLVSYRVNGSESTTRQILFILIILLYFYFRMAFQTNQAARYWLPVFLMITGLVEAVWGLRQLYGYSFSQHSLFGLTGSFFNPGPYAGYLAVVFPVAVYYLLYDRLPQRAQGMRKERKLKHIFASLAKNLCDPCGKEKISVYFRYLRRLIALLTFVAILLVLPATMSRASWLAAAAGSLFVLVNVQRLKFKIQDSRFKIFMHFIHRPSVQDCVISRFSLTAIRIVMIVAVGFLLVAAFAGMYYLKKDSADGRALMWKISLQTVINHPLGVGLGNFSGAYGETQAAYFASGKGTETEELVAGSPDYGFNEYLQIAVEGGVIALVLFLAIVFLSLRSLIVSRKWGMAGSLVSLLVFAFFSYPFSVLPFLIVFVFLLAGSAQMTQKTQIGANKNFKSVLIRRFCVSCVPVCCMIVTALCLYKVYPTYGAYRKWNTDKFLYTAGLYHDVVKNYEELYPLLNDQLQFLFEYAQSLSKTEHYTASNEVLKRAMQISCDPMLYNIMGKNHQALKEYQRAEACFIKASHIVPHRLYPYYLLALLYHEMGLQDKVDEMADIVQTKEPKVQSTAVREMRQEIRKIIQP